MSNAPIRLKSVPKVMYEQWGILKQAYDQWAYGIQEYREYGLYNSDLYRNSHVDVAEAIRRLPEDVYTARAHRIHRAIQVSRQKTTLPEAMWTKLEDPLHGYLEPYLSEVYKENKEKNEWNKK